MTNERGKPRKKTAPEPIVTSVGEPSDAAWRRFGMLAAQALIALEERRALAELEASEKPVE